MPPKAGKEKKKGKIGKKGKKGKKGPKTDINSEVDNNDKSGENDDGNYDDDNEIYGENCDERLDFCLFGGLEYNISTESIISIRVSQKNTFVSDRLCSSTTGAK